MGFKDLREYIDKLDEIGEVQYIEEEVDCNLEVGAIIRRSYDLKAPAPFFQKLKGYPEGYRILGAPAGPGKKDYARVAIAMGMDKDSHPLDIVENYINKKKNPIKPILIKDGSCKENIQIGNDVDLEKFPAPLIHEGDGGKYLGTWHIVATKDPDSNWVNWGMYRLMLHDKNSMGCYLAPMQHIGMIFYEKYEARNIPMEFAVAIGTEPVTPIIGATGLPAGINEVDVIGGIRGEPLELVKCETVDLYVPATSEIVIEGIINPNERRMEGPFGEYTGYRSGVEAPKPVLHVKAITHRNDPIITTSCMGVPVDDGHAALSITWSAEILDCLRELNLPVKMAWVPPYGVSHMVAVSTKVPYPYFAQKIAYSIWGSKLGNFMYYVVVTDDDIDVTDMGQLLWAVTTRCHPEKGVTKFPHSPSAPWIVTFLDPDDRIKGKGSKILFDCTWPLDWSKESIPVKSSLDVLWPEDIRRKVLSNWGKYGYKDKEKVGS
jgi:4-hydroxy-3-polyprenylbenzoate decarboxylase